MEDRREFLRSLLVGAIAAVMTHFGFQFNPPPVRPCPPSAEDRLKEYERREREQLEKEGRSAPGRRPPTDGDWLKDPTPAIGRIQFGAAGCTATVIGPRLPSGHYDVLTAAHCVRSPGQVGTLTLRSGQRIGLRVLVVEPGADVCWCRTIGTPQEMPFAALADRLPDPGRAVWHCGFGVHRPGNREAGQLVAGPNGQGQCEYRLSVSSGDSGGAIVEAATGRVLSPVCCTSRLSGTGRVFGGCPEVCQATRPRA